MAKSLTSALSIMKVASNEGTQYSYDGFNYIVVNVAGVKQRKLLTVNFKADRSKYRVDNEVDALLDVFELGDGAENVFSDGDPLAILLAMEENLGY